MADLLKEVERIEGKGPLWHFTSAIRLYVLAKEATAEKATAEKATAEKATAEKTSAAKASAARPAPRS